MFIDYGLACAGHIIHWESKYDKKEKHFAINVYKDIKQNNHLFNVTIKHYSEQNILIITSTHVGTQISRVSKYVKKQYNL